MRLLPRSRPRNLRTASRAKPLATAAQAFARNLLITTDGAALAGYRLGPVRWSYTSTDAKERALDDIQDGWARVVGHTVHERVLTRPHPIRDWAARLDARTPNPLPDVHACEQDHFTAQELADGACGCETWNKHLARQQHRIASTGQDDKVSIRYLSLGVSVPDVMAAREAIAGLRDGDRPSAAIRDLLDAERSLADSLAGPGWNAARLTEAEQAWVRHRSLAPGFPAPSYDTGGDPATAGNLVRWSEEPLDMTVSVTALRDGKPSRRAAQVLLAATVSDLTYPSSGLEPWMAYAEHALDPAGRSFSAEWSLQGRVVPGVELRAQSERDLTLALNEERNYHGFDEVPPAYTALGIDRAKHVRDQVTSGKDRESARWIGTISAVVSGADIHDERGRLVRTAEEVCLERSEAFTRLFAGNDLRMSFTPPPAQAAWLERTVPGQPREAVGYQRQLPLDYLAAAVPNMAVTVGDGHGPYLGYTRTAARRPVMHDSHYATEGKGARGRGANIWIAAGGLGAGKSVLLGDEAYQCVRRGIRTIVRDPSGPLMRLGALPEIAPHFLGINLLEGDDGTLSPSALIRTPSRGEFADTDEGEERYQRSLIRAQSERAALVRDIARRCLEADLFAHPGTQGVLRDAARRHIWQPHSTQWDLIDALGKGDEHSKTIAAALRDAATQPLLSLTFAPRGSGGDFARLAHRDAVLTVISTPGIKRASDTTPRTEWTNEELGADPVIYLSGLLTGRAIYDKPMDERAVLILDEAEDMTDGAAGRAFLTRLGRDHSKWNAEAWLSLKNVTGNILGEEMRNYVAGAFVGRTEQRIPAEAFLEILRIEDKGYANHLMGLSRTTPGEWVHLDADGNIGGMVVDVGHHPALAEVLFTNPAPAGASAWQLEQTLA